MPQILLLRHSSTVASEAGLLAGGKTDTPLSNNGEILARSKGKLLSQESFEPSEVFASTLSRTSQTAAIILNELNSILEVQKLPELDERSFGEYDGKPSDLLMSAFTELGPNPPTVENSADFIKRVMSGFENAKHLTTRTGLLIAHINVLAVIYSALFDKEHLDEFWTTYQARYCEGFLYTY